jgi:hypothetical protein
VFAGKPGLPKKPPNQQADHLAEHDAARCAQPVPRRHKCLHRSSRLTNGLQTKAWKYFAHLINPFE